MHINHRRGDTRTKVFQREHLIITHNCWTKGKANSSRWFKRGERRRVRGVERQARYRCLRGDRDVYDTMMGFGRPAEFGTVASWWL